MSRDDARDEVVALADKFKESGLLAAAGILFALAGSISINCELEMSQLLEEFVDRKAEETRLMAEILRELNKR